LISVKQRDKFHCWVISVSLVLAVGSLVYGWLLSTGTIPKEYDYGSYVVAFWTIIPPIYIWYDWVFLCKDFDTGVLDRVKTTHDLSRAIWVAFVALFTVMFKLNPLGPVVGAPGPPSAQTHSVPAAQTPLQN
jgi:hypothetical protein